MMVLIKPLFDMNERGLLPQDEVAYCKSSFAMTSVIFRLNDEKNRPPFKSDHAQRDHMLTKEEEVDDL
jgi:hypothetical protein